MSKTHSLPVRHSVWGQTLGRHCYSTDQQSQRASTHGFRDTAEEGGTNCARRPETSRGLFGPLSQEG